MRKLGIDLGIKRVGFAISDQLNIISQPLETFNFEKGNFALVITKIQNLCFAYEIDVFVLGYPLKMSGAKSQTTFMIEDFHKKLKNNFSQKIVLIDERLTSKKANQFMIDVKISRKKRKQKKDKMAAQLILNEYLLYGIQNEK